MGMLAGSGRANLTVWRLRLNWLLVTFLAPILYDVSGIGFLSSYHRFVTNPREDASNLNETKPAKFNEVEPGLGESELFYSLVLTALYVGAIIGGLLSGFLVRCVPYWYQYVVALSLHILGYVLYGVANQGWVLMISQPLVGYYLGAEITLSYSYANESSAQYAEIIEERGGKADAVKTRNYLFALVSVGHCLGYVVGPSIAVLLSHLPIEQYHSIAWFNVACGVTLLILFIVFFRGESYCKRMKVCSSSQNAQQKSRPSALQVFILITMFLLSLVDMGKWGVYETLLNPILSDSFGFSLAISSYVYLGLTAPRLLGSLLLVILQKMKVSTQGILLIGILLVTFGFALVADWQAIPYDPCTKYSPFHHPDILSNQSMLQQPLNSNLTESVPNFGNSSFVADSQSILQNSLFEDIKLQLYSTIELSFTSGVTVNVRLPIDFDYTCQVDTQCLECKQPSTYHDRSKLCLTFVFDKNMRYLTKDASANLPQVFSCSVNSFQIPICINIYSEKKLPVSNLTTIHQLSFSHTQSLQVLSSTAYSVASNACMNADVLDRECHWIPFSSITKEKCDDCPPICRSEQQTLNFAQFLIGVSLLIVSVALVWMPLMAIVSNQTPRESQGIVIGILTTMNFIAQAASPVILDAAYEGMQKRTFFISILLATLHVPFIVEIFVLNKHLGPPVTEHLYSKIESNDSHDCDD